EAERMGRMLGDRVVSAVAPAKVVARNDADAISLKAALISVDLPRRPLPTLSRANAILLDARAMHQQLKAAGHHRASLRTAEVAIFGAESLLNLVLAQNEGLVDRRLNEYQPFQVQVVRIGDVCIVGWPGEIFVEYALRLKRKSPRKTFITAYTNGELQGYIVTPEAAAEGGYEAASRLFEPAAGDVLVETALSLINRVYP
ncbi:MAG TPA: hypothetical protein VG722_08840, partial [Tepidisphaeraceae bacterium]|nr:hypothetical protein [Tepidisphaeraceae bacterium]